MDMQADATLIMQFLKLREKLVVACVTTVSIIQWAGIVNTASHFSTKIQVETSETQIFAKVGTVILDWLLLSVCTNYNSNVIT